MAYAHPRMKVARMETAVEVRGMQIAKLFAAIDDDGQLPVLDETAIEAIGNKRGGA